MTTVGETSPGNEINMAKPTLLLIDGNSLAFRAFYALINQVDRFVNHEGLHTNALVGFKPVGRYC